MRGTRRTPITEKDVQDMAMLRKLGVQLQDIAAHYEMTAANVAYYTRKTARVNIPVDRWLAVAPTLLMQEAA